jgi:2-phosphoglycerate kinase
MIDESRHSDHLRSRSRTEPLRGGDRYLDRFPTLRSIQAHLIEQAHAADVRIVGVHEATELTQDIVDEIALRATAAQEVVGA